MGFQLDDNGKPVYDNDITDPVGQFQAAADYADKVGGRLRGTTAQRNATPSRFGWEFFDTDLGYSFLGGTTGWKRQPALRGGIERLVVQPDGTTRVKHGLGFTPEWVQPATASHPSIDGNSRYWRVVWWQPETTNAVDFAIRLVDERNDEWATGAQNVRFTWQAGVN